MLMAEAVRLAAIEVLAPTGSIASGEDFPTLAGERVLDSREIKVNELDDGSDYTPVLALYTSNSKQENRAGVAGGIEYDSMCVLEVVGELAVIADDPENEGGTDALAGTDPEAKLVLAAMMAQVKYLLEEAVENRFFRKFVRSIMMVEVEPFAVPQLGLRWQRTTHRYTLAIVEDCFDFATGRPLSLEMLLADLPEGSYAYLKLAELIAKFTPQETVALEAPDVMQGDDGFEIQTRKDPEE